MGFGRRVESRLAMTRGCSIPGMDHHFEVSHLPLVGKC
jgi:hypothetical protein